MKRFASFLLVLALLFACAHAETAAVDAAQAAEDAEVFLPAADASADAAQPEEGEVSLPEGSDSGAVVALPVADLEQPAVDDQLVATDVALDEEQVKQLQTDLIGRGYLDGKADGVFGSGTQAAVRAAQSDLGLEVTGAMSDELLQALRENAFPLRLKCRSSLVTEIQEPLYRWGFLKDEPTGYYGESTEDAVTSFQALALEDFAAYMQSKSDAEFATLEVDSDVIVDQPLYNENTIACDGVMSEDWYHFLMEEYQFPKIIAQKGDSGDGVKLVQKRLHALGYLYSGMDGEYTDETFMALKYFQRRNGLTETGNCNEETSALLFTEDAKKSDEYVMPYAAYVNRSKSRVYIYAWDGSGYNNRVKTFKCSCGAPATPTIKGTFYCIGPISEWYYMKSSNVWVRYAFQIKGNYFFHSVLFSHRGSKYPTSTSVANLGRNVSHGCIRLAVDDVKWIYKHCTKGMKVVIK